METKERTFQMRTDNAFLALIDEWRRHEPDIPARAEAIRRLVNKGLEAERSAEGRGKGGEVA